MGMNPTDPAEGNLLSLQANEYPGRGIIIGLSPDAGSYIQVYWLMGRSEASRNRILVAEKGFVRTEIPDTGKVKDPSLLVYYPVKHWRNCHIVTNGDQTDTIYSFLKQEKNFDDALMTRNFEPDAPHYTPRISCLLDLEDQKCAYRLSIIKAAVSNPACCGRYFFHYAKAVPGWGHCLHTYAGNGNPLPPFAGEPLLVKVFNDPRETAEYYWNLLNRENKVALLVKAVCIKTGKTSLEIINKHHR